MEARAAGQIGRRPAMRRFGIPVSIFTLALVGLVLLGSRPSAVAQESTPVAMAGHPIVGAWLLDVDTNDPANPPALAIFHDDGTYLQAEADGGNGVGVWEATGAHRVALTNSSMSRTRPGNLPAPSWSGRRSTSTR
jgi:hypothetical protein